MFLVEYGDGKWVTETDTTWNKLPDKPIKMALLCNHNIVVGLTDMDEYWFSNQAVATSGGQGKLIAQILGGIKDGKITEFIQSAEDGKASIFFEDKHKITRDHKRGK